MKKTLEALFGAIVWFLPVRLLLMAVATLGLAGAWLALGLFLLRFVNLLAREIVWFTGSVLDSGDWRLLVFAVPWLGLGVFLWLRQDRHLRQRVVPRQR